MFARRVEPNAVSVACRHAMSRAVGVGPVTDEVCHDYIKHMEALICGGMLSARNGKTAAG